MSCYIHITSLSGRACDLRLVNQSHLWFMWDYLREPRGMTFLSLSLSLSCVASPNKSSGGMPSLIPQWPMNSLTAT